MKNSGKIIGSVEARMGSRRLPGKTLRSVWNSMSLLEIVVSRFRLCREVDEVVVATSLSPQDDAIFEWCKKNQVPCHRGSELDVLDRIHGVIRNWQPEALVQMGADSAYLDFELIDDLVRTYKQGEWDYVCNDLNPHFPYGIYGHVVRAKALQHLAQQPHLTERDKEDVVRGIFEHPETYRLHNIDSRPGYHHPELRLTVDYPEDFELAERIFQSLGRWDFPFSDLLKVHQENPTWFEPTKEILRQQRTMPLLSKHQGAQ